MFLGIEIGGTKLQLGLGPGDGTLVALERARVAPSGGAAAIRQQIVALVPKLLSNSGLSPGDIAAAAIGFGGPVDAKTGTVAKSHQVSGWEGFRLADWSNGEFGWRTVVHNDADTAGLAEATLGAGRGRSPIFYVTVGSGIGGGLIIDGQIYRGMGVGAAEIGHLRWPGPLPSLPEIDRPPATAPSTPVELLASGWAIANRVRDLISHQEQLDPQLIREAESLRRIAGEDLNQLTTELIAESARKGNRIALYSIDQACRVLGWAVASVIALVCPRRVVIGGGVSMLGEQLFLGPLRREVARHCFAPFAESYDIVPAALGESVVLHGALLLARSATLQSADAVWSGRGNPS